LIKMLHYIKPRLSGENGQIIDVDLKCCEYLIKDKVVKLLSRYFKTTREIALNETL
jgi:hypothetical protein